MKRALILLVMAVIAVSSCETLEDNSPAMQATIDSTFFRAGDVLGGTLENGDIVLQGVTQREVMEIRFQSKGPTTYEFGPGSLHNATITDSDGVVYTTDHPNGNGTMNISWIWGGGGLMNAEFSFLAISPLNDSLAVSRGVIYEGNFGLNNLIGVDAPTDANSLSASVNGTGFNPTQVTVNTTQGVVTTEATAANQTIIIQVPDNALPGAYNIGDVGYAAGYRVDGGTIIAQSGNITVVSNDTAARMMVIDFSFVAGEYEVTGGSMTIYY